ncbi:RagB/SusD family nutrient uptake outer membrane protein [Leeuwenhoekiella marinoflava]|uniref:RagB/SusD family nutrient uptake outer membrane protein n=1 Tax=Leeuwenhoekiella marinoflava TaxID=988 RepID=UPI0030016EA5
MRRYINTLILFSLFILTVSCSDDFLDRPPESQIIPEDYLFEESQLGAYTINLYGILPSHGNWSFGTFGIDTDTDNMADLSYDNKYVPGQWRVPQTDGSWSFTNIYNINYFLNTVLTRWKNGEITGSENLIEHYIGEAYFFRAYEYFNKVQALGDFPIVKKNYADDKEVLIEASKRNPRSEVVRFILSDLDSASAMMASSSPDANKNRLSKYSALLIKSRVALYEASWLKNFKGTAFVPNGTGWPGAEKSYNQGWQYEAGNIDAEIDWLLEQAMEASEEVAEAFSLTPNNGVLQQTVTDSQNPYFDMFSDTDMSGYNEVLLWRDYDQGLGVVHNVPVEAMRGNATVGLTKGLVDSFVMANGLPIYASGSGYSGDDYISDVRVNRDGRLWLFLKEPDQINVLYNLQAGTHVTPVEPIPEIINRIYSTGYTIRKGLNYDGAQANNGQGYTGSIVFRATEAYLNYIEASYLKTGSINGTAASYWREIRQRAGVDTDFNKTIAATSMSIEAEGDWGAYTAGQLIDPTLYNIRRERRNELFAEGLRWMDLKRWRAMDQLMTQKYHVEGFKLWGPMQNWYDSNELTYEVSTATVSAPSRSEYLRPYEKTGGELVYDGYSWAMAHYLDPIAIQHFLITAEGSDLNSSPIYQNPGWALKANEGAQPVN